MGEQCRYDGAARPSCAVQSLVQHVEHRQGCVTTVCPEVDGGLGCPRPAAERVGARVITKTGIDVTQAYVRGAQQALCCARGQTILTAHNRVSGSLRPLAVLKSKSPACGTKEIYDGTFMGTLTHRAGVAAELLEREGFVVVDEQIVEACRATVEHPIALVLGSGLGSLATYVKPVRRIPYTDIEGFPVGATPIPGHTFEVMIGTLDDVPVVVYPGRIHLYQGYSAGEVTSLVRHAYKLGCRDCFFACATGAVRNHAHEGLGVVSDHINLTGRNPLVERENLCGVESAFVGMTDAYTPYLRELALQVAADNAIELQQGVYAGFLGPSFETSAEVAMIGAMGASFAGMSLVCETIMARALGMHVLGLTLSANLAGETGVTHESVLHIARRYEDDFSHLVRGVVKLLV